MAIYHLTVKIGTKDKGHSAGGKCAYITRTETYAKKADECAYSASGNMPKWPKTNPRQDPAHYWKAADLYERDNGRLFREVEFALPRELSLDQQKALCHAFADRLTTLDKGEKLPFTFAIHTDKYNRNPHCHLMISERMNDGIPRNASTWFKRSNAKDPKKGGATKTQELNGKQWLEPTRQLWAQMANEAMKSALPDFYERSDGIDHRSHAKRGLAPIPSQHMGKACQDMMKRGTPCHRGQEIAKSNQKAQTMNHFMHRYPVPCSRIGKAVIQSFRRSSAIHFGGLRPDGNPKTMTDIMRDIERLLQEVWRANRDFIEQQNEYAKAELARINEQIRVAKEVIDVLGFFDTTSLPTTPRHTPAPQAPTPAPQPEQVTAEVAPEHEPKTRQPKPKTLKLKRPTPRPPWIVDTSARG